MSADFDGIDAFPLCWPEGWARHTGMREWGSFKGTPDEIRKELISEIDRMVLGNRARGYTVREYVILSTNIPLRRDGEPLANSREPQDPGVAVYFERDGKKLCFACDKYDRVWKNMRAIQKTLEAMRGIERWGSKELLDRTFTGFAALPAPGEGTGSRAWSILGIAANSDEAAIRAAYKVKAKTAHPDTGGNADAWHLLQTAYRDALGQIGKAGA